MENSQLTRRTRRPARALGVLALVPLLALAACSDDGEDTTDGTVLVDADFPGDSLDAVCARLEAAEGDDREQIASDLLDELIPLGGVEVAVNTLEQAARDTCPDWADAVDAAITARP